MTIPKHLKIDYDVYSSIYSIKKQLNILFEYERLSFDTETQSLYSKQERKEAQEYLKEHDYNDPYFKDASVVANSDGLSYPSLVKTTHFVFGISRTKSVIFICDTPQKEILVWKELTKYDGLLFLHNTLFDLKIMYQRVQQLPKNYIDTALFVRCFINDVNNWKCKVSLKHLMSEYYDPKWTLMNEYEPEDLKNKNFLDYTAIDGAATFYLAELINEQLPEDQKFM